MSWFDPRGKTCYGTAHMQAIRSHSCFKGAAYPRVPLGSSQEKPSAIQTHLLYLWQRGLGSLSAVVWAVLLSVEMFMQTSSSTQCVYTACARVCVCVMQAIDIQHVQAWERNGRTTMWVEWVMGGKKKVVRMKWSLKNNCIPLWNVCVPAKLQRCRKANSMKMWRRRWIWLYGWAKKECFHPGFSPTFSSNTCNVTSTFLIALTLPAP